ncbi:hypothetical protein ACFX16_038342 [Malus domestica]
MHQHLAPSVGNDTKSYVGSLSFFHLTTVKPHHNLYRESAETQESNICIVTAKLMSSISAPGHGGINGNKTLQLCMLVHPSPATLET